DLSAGEIGLEIGRPAGIRRKDLDGRMEANFAYGCQHFGIIRTIETCLNGVDIDRARTSTDEHEVVSALILRVVAPHRAVRENIEERGELAFDGRRITVVD